MKRTLLLLLITFQSMLLFGQATATIPNITAAPGSITVPVNVTSFNNIGAITMYIEYDPAVVSFSGFNNAALGSMDVNAYVEGSSHRIGIAWSATGGTGSTVSGLLLNLVFNYISGAGSFTFLSSGCEVVSITYNKIPVQYTNGGIGPINPALVTIPQMLNKTPANGLEIPVNVDFRNIASGVNSFTFIVEYDGSKLVYQNFNEAALSNIDITPLTNPTRLAIEWLDAVAAGSKLNGKLIDLVFNYTGGTSTLVFDEVNCHMADHNVIEAPVVYTDGLVSQNPASVVSVTVENVTAFPGSTVLVPVKATNFDNVGAFDFLINYNKTLLNFVELANINPRILPLANLASNTTATGVGINWRAAASALAGLTIPAGETLFEMKFTYTSGSTALTFGATSAVSNFGLNAMTVNYVNGSVSQVSDYNASVTIPDIATTPSTIVNLPLNVTGFSDIEGFYMVVAYNGSVLNFTNLVNIPSILTTKGTLDFNATGGKLYIIWTINLNETAGVTIADNSKLFDMQFSFINGSSDLVFDQSLCVMTKYGYNPVNLTYSDGSVNGGNKTLNLKVFLEGLYNTSTGKMNKAKDYVAGAVVDKYTGSIADHITIELHDATSYSTIIYWQTDVELNQDGTASISLPSTYQGSYYLTVKQRNHIETVSSSPISFAVTNINYNFTNSVSQVYGNNQKLLSTGVYGIFAGDINQDRFVDIIDAGPTNTGIRLGNKGYVSTDINGDGFVDIIDAGPLNTNIRLGIHSQFLP